MSGDEKFWLGCWSLVAGVIAVIVLSISSCTSYRASLLNEMVRNGADPLQASCALDIGERKDGLCGVVAAKR